MFAVFLVLFLYAAMPSRILHIVSFDNPFSPAYGGTIEVYSKLRPLHDLGIEIHLHCFVKHSPPQIENPEYCKAVYFYPESGCWKSVLSRLPFSVASRSDKMLKTNIDALPGPILFEGLKTTYGVYKGWFAGQRKILRLHNVEHLYFFGVAASENRLLYKLSYYLEGLKYKRYEAIIDKFDQILTLSRYEQEFVKTHYRPAYYVPVFHSNKRVVPLSGIGHYALYHGDLRMSDNRRVAENLIDVFGKIPDVQLVIAGSAASRAYFIKRIGSRSNVRYETLTDFTHLKQLLADAHINLVFSYQRSGTKLKLMNALFFSRFCIVNANVMDDEMIQPLCVHAQTNIEIISQINRLKEVPFSGYAQRREVLENHMSDDKNARQLVNLIFN